MTEVEVEDTRNGRRTYIRTAGKLLLLVMLVTLVLVSFLLLVAFI